MKISIIGAGNMGLVLARKLVDTGHEVEIANSRGPDTLADVCAQTGVLAVDLKEMGVGAAALIIAVPQKSVPHLPKSLFAQLPRDLIVVDTGNYYPTIRDGRIEAIEGGLPESQWVSREIGRPVIKAFNSIFAQSLATKSRSADDPERVALPIAGDSAAAKADVMDLVETLGFTAIDAGTLEESWRQQPGAPAYCTDLGESALRKALARADRAQLPADRERQVQMMLAESAN